MKILVTGASGLLGSALMKSLDGLCEIAGTYNNNPAAGLIPLSITGADAIRDCIVGHGYTHVIHCAANRDPDSCLREPENAYKTNALAVEYIAQSCREAGARLIHISSDYVFDGKHAPYREDALTSPVNLYGRTKLTAEMAARAAGDFLIVRIPALYSLDLDDTRNVLANFAKLLRTGETKPQDGHTVRYYTRTDDVARGIRFCVEQDLTGVIHLTADQRTTKADFVRRIAVALGLDPALAPDGPPPTSGDVRPFNSRLGNEKYKNLGGPPFASIDESLAIIKAG